MLKDILKIIIIDSLPILAILLILRKIFKLTKIPIFLLIVFSMLIISLYNIYTIEVQINDNYNYLFK